MSLYIHTPDPRNILVIGGGDGGTAREVLRHPQVERVTLVEIDRRVVEVSREFLPEVSCAFDDPRLEVRFEDGVAYLQQKRDEYDVILVDSPEPIGQAGRLFSGDFYRSIRDALRSEGLFSASDRITFCESGTHNQGLS